MEAADAGIQLIVCIAEGIPTLDVIKAHQFIKQKGAILVGPNCPGLISPGKSMVSSRDKFFRKETWVSLAVAVHLRMKLYIT